MDLSLSNIMEDSNFGFGSGTDQNRSGRYEKSVGQKEQEEKN